uniref:Trichome birefringence-like C-terminal domain-containing protein n=1 Tax=Nelumbo nucifera TaxID=4432 RepID=A0A822XGU4_NELNU|nr:TPA_asm: hypothetical protein HUJ06_020910 [Nelumbo nucifera]
MIKNPLAQDPETMPIWEFLNKLKRLKPHEPSLGILGFLFITVVCFLSCFFYLDYRIVTKGFRVHGQSQRFMWLGFDVTGRDERVGFLAEGGEGCDLFKGDWVWDEQYPLYQSKDCRFLDEGFRCTENGRPDNFYTKWRWQPKDCNLPRGCYFQEGEEIKMDASVESAYQKSIETLINWLGGEVNMSKTQVFFRTFAPVHFRGGDWKTGGSCHLETLPELGASLVPSGSWSQLNIVNGVLLAHSNKSQVMQMDVLNVTHMTSRRKDGHLSLYYLGSKIGPASLHRQDCSHWCLPGVPDAWNELLYAFFLKREATRTHSLREPSEAQI